MPSAVQAYRSGRAGADKQRLVGEVPAVGSLAVGSLAVGSLAAGCSGEPRKKSLEEGKLGGMGPFINYIYI